MAEGCKKKSRKGEGRHASHVGLALFHAISNMTTLHKPDELAKGDGEMHERNPSLPTIDEADELKRNNGAVEERDMTENGYRSDETGKSEGGANLVSCEALVYVYTQYVVMVVLFVHLCTCMFR